MADVAAIKCSTRRTYLRQVKAIVDRMIEINEAAALEEVRLLAAMDAADVEVAMNALLATCGPQTVIATGVAFAEAGDADSAIGNLSNQLHNMLFGVADPTNNIDQISWQYTAE